LWDRFPDSTRLGGAPLNFAVHLRRLGHWPLLVSAVGRDALGEQAHAAIAALGLDTSFVQSTPRFATGSATVSIGPGDQTTFTIARPAAYDAVALSAPDLRHIIEWRPDWIYFGTLFASRPEARDLLQRVVNGVPDGARIYDMNLRPGFDSPELVHELLKSADVVKLNEQELRFVHEELELPADTEEFCRAGRERYGWRAACVTLGARGCAMLVEDEYTSAPGVPIDVGDPVGAGDAFAAAFVHGLVSRWPIGDISRFANQEGARVASAHGAIPDCLPHRVVQP
jgi:fructokinase